MRFGMVVAMGTCRRSGLPYFLFGAELMRPCNRIINKTIALAEQMAKIADDGDYAREDANCGVLYGILRDAAFKIRKLAEEEREAHKRKGWWAEEAKTAESENLGRNG